ncbi:MAG: hypothetical protein KTR29_10840 [Rhodothermaceae bacterium]|nr:hypothetical protein [Rhodothermaceae bacterium]
MSILLLESVHPDAKALLEAHFDVQMGEPAGPLPSNIKLDAIEAIITRGRGRITASLIQKCPNLKAIARCGAGLDNIDVDAAAAADIPVVFAPGKTASAVAEHTLLLMLAMARRLPYLTHEVCMGNWDVRASYEGMELRGKTLGLVGLGAIGKAVASLAHAFGMRIVYWSRSAKDVPYARLEFNEVLTQSDFISLHTALNSHTRHLIGPVQLDLIRPTAFLINTARGGLVDEETLLKRLDARQIAGYATDLLEKDPPDNDHPFFNHPRTMITPHTAVLTDRTYRDICVSVAQNVSALLHGQPPEHEAIFKA